MAKVNEIWLPIDGTNGAYEISNHGRVKRLGNDKGKGYPKNDRYLPPNKDKYGYYRASMPINGVIKTIKIHQLVSRHFIPNPECKKTVNHINGIKTDNHVDNLEWCTHAENNIHAFTTGLKNATGVNNGRCKLTDIQVVEIFNAKGRYIDIAKLYNISDSLVGCIKRKENWTHLTNAL